MNTTLEIFRRAQSFGLQLEADGGDLLVRPRSKCPPAFVAELKQHKAELLDWLETRTTQLSPDQVPWLHVSRQILAGEFIGADNSTRESLRIGLRSINHPLCQSALHRLAIKSQRP